jgi:hypothetical protein
MPPPALALYRPCDLLQRVPIDAVIPRARYPDRDYAFARAR